MIPEQKRMQQLPWDEVLDRLRKHDKVMIRDLYRDIFPKVRAYVLKNGGNQQTAEDVFQEALISLYKSIRKPGFRVQTSLTQYLFAVSKYIWIKKLKKGVRETGTYSVEEALIYEEMTETAAMEDERHILLFEKLGQLSGDCRQVLSYFFQGYSMGEIAKKMGYQSEAYTRKRKYKCKKRLMKLIREDSRYQELKNNG